MQDIFSELKQRGLVQQATDEAALSEHLNSGMRALYCGFDPTADSLHVGSMIPLVMLRRFQLAGHKPIALVGGATGLIGDPSFKDAERQFNTADTVAYWTECLRKQAGRFLDFDKGANSAEMANNLDWTKEMSVITFLREIGKHFSVNAMINRDAIRARLEREGSGISYTEFSYCLLQAMDFLHLFRHNNCTFQVGGSDQWGNIVSGVDLIRRVEGGSAHCMTMPLLLKADGKKFGKSESGTVWVDSAKTSVFKFYQFWLNVADADVEKLLFYYSFRPVGDIREIAKAHAGAPEKREGQRLLARDVTTLVHGEAGLAGAERITEALFGGGDVRGLTEEDMDALKLDGLEGIALEGETPLVDVLVAAGLATSKRQAREFIEGKAVKVNGEVVGDTDVQLGRPGALYGRYFVLQRGKKEFRLAWFLGDRN